MSKKDILKYFSSIVFVIFLIAGCSKPNFETVEVDRYDFTDIDTFTITDPNLNQLYLFELNKEYQLQDKISGCKSDIQKA